LTSVGSAKKRSVIPREDEVNGSIESPIFL
jgi:hypothetical protein